MSNTPVEPEADQQEFDPATQRDWPIDPDIEHGTEDESLDYDPKSKAKLTLDPNFGDVGDTIDEDDALRILTGRLRDTQSTRRAMMERTGQNYADYGRYLPQKQAELARRLLRMIPENMRTEVVLKNGDIRPLLNQVAAWNADDPGAYGLTSEQRYAAGQYLLQETDRIKESAEKAILPNIPAGDDKAAIEAANLVDYIVNGYKKNRIVRVDTTIEQSSTGTLATNPQTGEVVATGGLASAAGNAGLDVSDLNGEEIDERPEFISRDEIQYLARESLDPADTVGYLLKEDAERRQGGIAPGESQYQVLYDDTLIKKDYNVAKSGKQTIASPNRMTAREVVDLPSTMSRGEIHTLATKMKAAGLMTQDMVDPTDYSDPAFKTAWQTLMYKSIERNESMLSVLDGQAKARKNAIEDAYTPLLTDPARIRMNANALAGTVLGRDATDEEQNQLVEYMHGLERRNQKIQAGFDPDAVGTLDELKGEAVTADLEARMQEWIKSKNPEEAGAHDVDDSYDKLTQLLGGPGQPGLVR